MILNDFNFPNLEYYEIKLNLIEKINFNEKLNILI